MPDDEKPKGWERVAALIDECRREREACAFVRDHLLENELKSRTALTTIATILLGARDGPADLSLGHDGRDTGR